MSLHDIVVIGASAGGLHPLIQLVSGLPACFPAAIFVVVHIPAGYTSILPDMLRQTGRLPAAHAHDGQAIVEGHVYVAPSDHHLILDGGVMHLYHGPKENYSRPAIDPLFRSAA